MRKSILLFILLLILPINSGCFWLFAGAAVGYEASPDSMRTYFNTSFSRAYHESLVVMRSMGKTTMEDEKGGWIKGEFDNYKIAVHIEQLTSSTVQVTVSARKYTTPRPQKARDVLDKISSRLR